MKNKGYFLLTIVSLMIIIGNSSLYNMYSISFTSPDKNQPHLDYLIPTDFSWTAFTYEKYDFTSPTYDDSIEYSVNETMIYLHELNSYDCIASIYTLVPVTNNHLVISGEFRAKAGHIDARNAAVLLKDPTTFTGVNVNVPAIIYHKDNSLDSGFQYFGVDYHLPGYTEVILEFTFNDGWSTDWGQTLWVRNLQIHTEGDLPIRSQVSSIPDITIYDWSFGTFIRGLFSSPSPPLTPIVAGDFEYSVNSTHVYVGESGFGTSEAFVGAYTTVPVVDDHLAFSFNVYATCDVGYRASMRIRFFNPETKARIQRTLEVRNYNKINNTIKNQYIEFNVTLPGLDEVNILFFYEDGGSAGSSGNDNHKLWISELKVFTLDTDPPLILCENELICEEGSTGNYINWTLIDDNPDNYSIYRDNVFLISDTWTNNEIISYNVDLLPIGTHNFTLIAYDQLGNTNQKSISIFVIAQLTEKTPFLITMLVSIAVLSISTILLNKKRR